MSDYLIVLYVAGLLALLYELIKPLDLLSIEQITSTLISQEWLGDNFIILFGILIWPALVPIVLFIVLPIILFPKFFFELFREFDGPGVHL